MAFFINTIKQKARDFFASQLTPLQADIEKTNQLARASHHQTMQALQLIAAHISPDLRDQLPAIGTVDSLLDGKMVIVPHYERLLRPDDVFLVSYPRSGNTWLRAICAYLLYPAQTMQTLKDLDEYVPDLYVKLPTHDRYSTPRVFKSHEPYATRHGHHNTALYQKYIYVLRHPFKVIESYYHFETNVSRRGLPDLDTFLDMVLNNAFDYGGWGEHVTSWQYAQKYAQSVLFLRYEDVQKHPIAYIQRTGRFLGVVVDDAQAEQVRIHSSQESMRELDNKGAIIPGFEMVRAGEQRQLATKLTDAMKEAIYTRYQAVMDAWGYAPDGTVADEYPLKATFADKG
ncbi:MAG: sulfotransferase domain-containing protein [bacterium]|nr:sulfotransferase domain-containing protein [bacterium]